MPIVYMSGNAMHSCAAHRAMILADHVQLAADVLRRRLHPRQDVADDAVFEVVLSIEVSVVESVSVGTIYVR